MVNRTNWLNFYNDLEYLRIIVSSTPYRVLIFDLNGKLHQVPHLQVIRKYCAVYTGFMHNF